MNRTGVLFVCLGNICRSPLAKAVFIHHARARGVLDRFDVDSCGTGHWHAGGPADPRTIATCRKYGIPLDHVARQVDPVRDFRRFPLLLAMDASNRATLLHLGAGEGQVRLVRSFDPALADQPHHRLDVPDPYSGDEGGFDRVYEMLDASCRGLLDTLTRTDA